MLARTIRSTLLLLLAPLALGAQTPQTRLKPPLAALAEEFGRVYSVREIADGRVLISDNSSASRLVVADLATGSVKELGRAGNGPGEYQYPTGRLLPLGGDSTLLTSGSRPPRWVLLQGATIVESVPMDSRAFLAASNAVSADQRGNVLALRETGTIKYDGPYSLIKVSAIRANRSTGRTDTVAILRGAEMSNRQVGTAAKPFMISSQATFSVPEQAMLFPDGWIGVVRLTPYHVEWISPDGKVDAGPDLGWKPVKVDDRERKAYDARVARRTGRPVDSSKDPWTSLVPPIRSGALIPAPDGTLWIARSQWSGMEDNRYDVVDRRGVRINQVVMSVHERVVGFGKGAVFIAVVDDDGIERLQKHPWP